jgi:hypothetical protein
MLGTPDAEFEAAKEAGKEISCQCRLVGNLNFIL